jgi:UDPglucose--hexose-1-phosphate uridylyltransferase
MKNLREYLEEQINENLIQAVLSAGRNKDGISKIKIRPIRLKGQICYQASATEGQKVLHKNYGRTELIEYVEKELAENFRQFQAQGAVTDGVVLVSKKGKMTIKQKHHEQKEKVQIQAHNRVKQYILKEGEYVEPEEEYRDIDLEEVLNALLDEAVKRNLIEDSVVYRDLFDTRLMNCLMPRPAQVQNEFWSRYEKDPQEATDYFYKLSQDSDYIRRYRVKKDQKWTVDSEYGKIDITINLSKPEKDPKAIAAAKLVKSSSYPKCLLCPENEGYAGRVNHPARENHRIIPITVNDSPWGFQYSPYVYYNEHCIVFNSQHVPMKIEKNTFIKLFDFVKLFPHYFLGSNADLPIVGGSILSHDHFQGGHYTFAMAKAPIEKHVTIPGYEDVEAGIVKWPLSVLRIRHKDEKRLIELATHVLEAWRGYTDESAFIFAETDGEPHNTITPIARRSGDMFELDLTLRNNITTDEHPLGVYHPHAEYHHIKKENIGLIEVMGLAVLPARLKEELELLAEYILEGKDISSNEKIEKHAAWVAEFLPKYDNLDKDNIQDVLRKEVGNVFVHVLEDAGVYKCTAEGREAFMRFINKL